MNIPTLSLVAIFIGGGLGSIARFLLSKWIIAHSSGFPTATFVTNFLACIVLGFLAYYLGEAKKESEQLLAALFMTGFCGGFSTFSTLNLETFKLIQAQNYQIAFLYTFSNIIIGFLGIAIGFWLIGLFK
ncbi:camphor resistance protein CrcB [Bernardetia litoralis DSM 6794]|uniref:Fluoride-specific ion channel FluC n=1 Tax=Bernardetia litoralis (strain ATCC 23117 / DSM 6794 / NBRC 15988 / NCIMB 1366 / Fx l1 / Sio-4) TaxID=880071 RepID=I4AMY3_BERLS|nr:fluoride efflux transporter CrcB [Bernardetia litoralis]AFM05318.1 camphor resistance protein CrcB [Bernardetia litoralis DSM 6794]